MRTGSNISNAEVNVTGSYTYNGMEQTPTAEEVTVKLGEKKLTAETDYTVTGATNNQNAGTNTATVTVTGAGNYSGSKTANFTIKQVALPAITLSAESTTYNGSEQKPAITNTGLVENTDYEVSYVRGDAATTDFTNAGEIKITVTGKGNYTGSAEKTYTIEKATPTITWSSTSQELTYTGNPAAIIAPAVTLVGSETFNETITYSYEKDGTTYNVPPTDAGTYSIKASVAAAGNYTAAQSADPLTLTINKSQPEISFKESYNPGKTYDRTAIPNPVESDLTITGAKWEDVQFSWSGDHLNVGTYTLTATIPAMGNTEEATAELENIAISAKTVNSPTVTITPKSYVYTGSDIIPTTVVVKDGENIIPDTEYTLSYSDNINVGTNATVTVTDKDGGNYVVNGSETFEITKASQTPLNIAYEENIIYGGTYEPSISGGSGNGAVTWAVTGPATVDNAGKVTVTGVGEITVTATKAEDNNYTGISATCTLTAAQRPVTITDITGDTVKTCDGTTSCNGNGLTLTLNTILNSDDVTATANYVYDNAAVGEGKTVTASNFALTGTDAENYCIAPSQSKELDAVGEITKAAALTPKTGALKVLNKQAKEYTVELSDLLPTPKAGMNLGVVSYTLGAVSIGDYYDSTIKAAKIQGSVLTLPIQAVQSDNEVDIGTVSITISSDNFEDMTATINVSTLNKTSVKISGVSVEGKIYDGQPIGYTGTPVVTTADGKPVNDVKGFTYTWSTGTAPVNAGSYTLTVAVVADDPKYIGSANIEATIDKASVTITAHDKNIKVGEPAPAFTETDYDVTGLVGDDHLKTLPTLSYKTTPVTSAAGSVDIIASGAVVPDGGNYENAITYVPGKLTISNVAVNGVSLNKTSLTLQKGSQPDNSLIAKVAPENATNKDVIWKSNNPDVASVDNGAITAKSAGTATIIVTTVDGSFTAPCIVTVNAATYTVSYDPNGGSGTMPSDTAIDGKEFLLPGCGLTPPAGKMFDAWAVGSVNGEQIEAGTSLKFNADTTLYAIWKDVPPTSYTVTYHANGGSGTMENSIAPVNEAFALPGCGLTPPSDKTFDCWAIGGVNGPHMKPGENCMFSGNTTIYAVWTDIPYKITGTVLQKVSDESKTNPVYGAVVLLTRGAEVIAQQSTNERGAFSFPGITSGTYNLVAEKDGITMTIMQEIDKSSASPTITLPAGKTNSVVEVKTSESDTKPAPQVVVGDLEKVFNDNTVYTETDKETVKTGGAVELKMEVKKKDNTQAKAEIEKIETIKPENQTLGLVLDLTITKTVTKADKIATPTTEEIKEVSNLIKTLIFLPAELQGKGSYTVYRKHGNEVTALSSNGGINDERYEVSPDKTSITIFAKNYSTYAIGYTDSFTITFDAGDGKVFPTSAITGDGGKLSSADIPTPELTGYTFQGWYMENNNDSVTDQTVFSADTTVSARWKQNPVKQPDNTDSSDDSSGNSNSGSSGGSSGGGGSSYGGGGSSSGGGSYSVGTTAKPTNGNVAIDKKNATKGSTVTITVTPAEGYALDTLTVTDAKNNKLKLTDKGNGKYTFTMPGSKVNVDASFVKAGAEPNTSANTDTESESPTKAFSDLPSGAWYQEAVEYVLSEGIMNGYGDGKFGPDKNLSRAQLAQILYNREGRPERNGASSFTDVVNGKWYTDAVVWANQKGIVGGYGNGLFGSDDPITREQLAVMLWRYAGESSATNKELHFSDAGEAGSFASEALQWAVENGIITGYGDGRINPKGLATRAQVAQMLMRYLKGMEEK